MAAQYNIAIQQLAQIGHAEKIAQELQAHPEVQSQAARQLAQETLKHQSVTIEKSDDAKKTRTVSSHEKKRRERQQHATAKNKITAEDEEEPASSSSSPWAGNILNLKI